MLIRQNFDPIWYELSLATPPASDHPGLTFWVVAYGGVRLYVDLSFFLIAYNNENQHQSQTRTLYHYLISEFFKKKKHCETMKRRYVH